MFIYIYIYIFIIIFDTKNQLNYLPIKLIPLLSFFIE